MDASYTVEFRYRAYEMTRARNASKIDLRVNAWESPTPDVLAARRVRETMQGPGVYVLYAKHTDLVKIGKSTNVFGRWASLEASSGQYLQLCALIRSDSVSYSALEALLHQRFSEHRTIGEWFSPKAPIEWIRRTTGEGA